VWVGLSLNPHPLRPEGCGTQIPSGYATGGGKTQWAGGASPAPPLTTLEELTTEDAEFTELDDDFDAKLFFAEGLGGFNLGGAVGGHGVGGDPDGYE
jgi:hypothetical protein